MGDEIKTVMTDEEFKELNDTVYDVLKKLYVEDPDSLTGAELAILTSAAIIRAADLNDKLNQIKASAWSVYRQAEGLITDCEKGEYKGDDFFDEYRTLLPVEAANIALFDFKDAELSKKIYQLDDRCSNLVEAQPLPPGWE
jgi:hypothetical protein